MSSYVFGQNICQELLIVGLDMFHLLLLADSRELPHKVEPVSGLGVLRVKYQTNHEEHNEYYCQPLGSRFGVLLLIGLTDADYQVTNHHYAQYGHLEHRGQYLKDRTGHHNKHHQHWEQLKRTSCLCYTRIINNQQILSLWPPPTIIDQPLHTMTHDTIVVGEAESERLQMATAWAACSLIIICSGVTSLPN